jgi:Skp family chaperone for outer membrane proteins
VKRTVFIAAGVALMGVAFYVGSQMHAQAPRPLQTRVALVNMVQVLKNYKKAQNFEAQIRDRAKGIEAQLKPYQDQLIKLRDEKNNPATSAQRKEQIDTMAKKISFEGEQKQEELKKDLIKINNDYVQQVYREVEQAVTAYARSQNYEMVLFYNDVVTAEDFYHPETLKRKLQLPAALMPMMVSPGMDISDAIVKTLNAPFAGGGTPAGVPNR